LQKTNQEQNNSENDLNPLISLPSKELSNFENLNHEQVDLEAKSMFTSQRNSSEKSVRNLETELSNSFEPDIVKMPLNTQVTRQ
jgi:hypothetical protein